MPTPPEPSADYLARYQAAVYQVPVLSRVVFRLHRFDNLAFGEIADRLGIDVQAVQGCLSEALLMVSASLDGDPPHRSDNPAIAPAEYALRLRYRAYCEGWLDRHGFHDRIPWDDARPDSEAVSRILFDTMPPIARETFVCNRVGGKNYAEIARSMRTFRWIVRWRMLRAIQHIARGPGCFETWLWEVSRRS
jgi:DNA-directed RNA polymerase specialized sigma24 family protein